MALVRILIDGYSLLHQWPELAAGKPRHSEAARNELIGVLTQYQDATGTPVTVIFDGAGTLKAKPKAVAGPAIEVLFSRAGQTADQVIERVTHRLVSYGEVMVVTDDRAERDTVTGFGALAVSCANFLGMLDSSFADLENDLQQHRLKQRRQFERARSEKP